MSDEEVRKEEEQPFNGKEKKPKTLAGATHLLKAKALQQLELKEGESSKSVGKGDSIDSLKSGGPKSSEETATASLVVKERAGTSLADSKKRPEGTDSKNLQDFRSEGEAGIGLGKNQDTINNSNRSIGDLGDDSTKTRGAATEDISYTDSNDKKINGKGVEGRKAVADAEPSEIATGNPAELSERTVSQRTSATKERATKTDKEDRVKERAGSGLQSVAKTGENPQLIEGQGSAHESNLDGKGTFLGEEDKQVPKDEGRIVKSEKTDSNITGQLKTNQLLAKDRKSGSTEGISSANELGKENNFSSTNKKIAHESKSEKDESELKKEASKSEEENDNYEKNFADAVINKEEKALNLKSEKDKSATSEMEEENKKKQEKVSMKGDGSGNDPLDIDEQKISVTQSKEDDSRKDDDKNKTNIYKVRNEMSESGKDEGTLNGASNIDTIDSSEQPASKELNYPSENVNGVEVAGKDDESKNGGDSKNNESKKEEVAEKDDERKKEGGDSKNNETTLEGGSYFADIDSSRQNNNKELIDNKSNYNAQSEEFGIKIDESSIINTTQDARNIDKKEITDDNVDDVDPKTTLNLSGDKEGIPTSTSEVEGKENPMETGDALGNGDGKTDGKKDFGRESAEMYDTEKKEQAVIRDGEGKKQIDGTAIDKERTDGPFIGTEKDAHGKNEEANKKREQADVNNEEDKRQTDDTSRDNGVIKKGVENESKSIYSDESRENVKTESKPANESNSPKQESENGQAVSNTQDKPITTEDLDISEDPAVLEKSQKPEKSEVEDSGDAGDSEETKEDAEDGESKKEDERMKGGDLEETADHTMPADYYYDFDELVSKPHTTEGIPKEMVQLYHSFGFECTKRSNMHMVDNENMIFAAGNMVQILNLKSNKKKYIRSIKSGGIGAIAVHPSRKYFAVAEKGEKPDIVIYEYPSLRIYRILREGTEKAYANLDFSPNGEKLASVGSAPDFMLTVWDWINENIVLRSKAFSQDVYKVAFSPENEGHLCTSGTAHIRFWSMATTFTGLKLQGELGRFGTTELSDIAGFVELPDGKVLSGSEWGNMLLWDGGLIKVEIARKGKKTCHHGMIEQFFLDEGELITIGVDGYVKVWDFETIDTAEAADESKIFEMEPMSELKVGTDVKLVSMVKSVNADEASIWYAQDGAGGIWKLDLSFSHTSQAPKRLFSYHAGAIRGLAPSPMTHLSATIGEDHTVRLYDYLARTPLCVSKFTTPGTSILWMPKLVDPDGLSLLTGFNDGVVRQLTVVKGDQNSVTVKKNGSGFELKLTQVFKPHVKAVTSLAVSKDGKFLATGSDDSTVFFFSIEKRYKPVGFIETGAPVVSLDWSSAKKGNTLLICCKDGCVLEVSCPSPDDHDTSKTFLIPLTGLKRTEFKFKSIKDKLVKAEDDLRKAKEEEERRKQQEAEKRKRKERGIEDDEEDEENKEEETENEEREETPTEEIMHEPGQIVNGFYKSDTDNFWLLLDGWDAGYLYECAFPTSQDDDVISEPVKAVKFEDIDDVPVRSHCFSKTGQYLALGLDNGAVRVQLLESRDIEQLNSYWSLNMHDNHHGAVTEMSMSFDEKFLLSAGKDGNFFIYSFMDEEKLKKLIGKQKAEIAKQLESSKIARVDDIEDPNHYSIELEKQKAEHDRMVRLAEEKKQQTRQTISLLRREFKGLVSRNQELPSYLQLPPADFIIDPNMKDDIEAETSKKLDLVEREMAWESEKYSLLLRKLETRFKDMIECERFRLHAFRTDHTVSSYRATILPPEFNEIMEQNKNRIKTAEAEAGAPPFGKKFSILAKKFKETSKEESSAEDKLKAKKSKPIQHLDGKIAKAIEKAEQKKQRRMERKAKWDELYRSKPDLDYEDPVILAGIKEAQENMGDFKLKSAKDYIVPEKERVNADKKRIQLMQLKEQIHQHKRHFNEKLLNLRDKKMAVIAEVKSLIGEVENVQNDLPLSMHIALPPVPTMLSDEQPEKLFEYTSESLSKFKKEMVEQDQNLKTENTGGFGGGFGGFGGGEQPQQPSTKMTSQLTSTRAGTEQRGRSTSILSTLSSQPRSGSSIAIDHGSPETISEETLIDDEPSDMELRIRDEQKIRTIYRRDMLLRKIKELLVTFDAELRMLRHDKIHLDVDLKSADLRMITLFEELVLLKEFEKRENILMGKVELKMQERADMDDKVDDCQMKLQSKKEEIEKLQEKEKSLSAMFSNLFVESNKFEAFLTRVYKKKIKRVKKTEQDAGSDEDSDEDFSDDDYDSDEDEDSDAEELDDSVCPPGCDQALFDQVCQLREKRLDLEEATVEEKKAAETLKKELDALKKKAKVIESALMTAEADLEAFQREKQQKLNELDIVVTLKLSQLQYLNNNALPQDLSQCLVFTSTSLDGLQRRISELDKEKAEQKKLYWKLRQQHVTLIRDKKSMEERIAQLEEKVQQMQLLKFGKLVDLEKLENVSVNRAAEELKEQLRTQEFANAKEIAAWEKRIDDAKAKLTQVTRENTQRLDTYTVLLQERKELEQQLDSRQKNLGGEFQGNRKADFQERQRLIQLVQLQSQEIDALKEEIGLLSRKGGHILPPSQAPVPTAPASTR